MLHVNITYVTTTLPFLFYFFKINIIITFKKYFIIFSKNVLLKLCFSICPLFREKMDKWKNITANNKNHTLLKPFHLYFCTRFESIVHVETVYNIIIMLLT